MPHDTTTQHMIEAARARGAKPEATSVALALLDARFRAFEITMHLDTVIAALRAVNDNVKVDREVA